MSIVFASIRYDPYLCPLKPNQASEKSNFGDEINEINHDGIYPEAGHIKTKISDQHNTKRNIFLKGKHHKFGEKF